VVTIEREDDRERTQKLIEKAERTCLISRSLLCGVSVEAKIKLEEPVAAE
jgi:organic hydroperoxide reductase OsmC/OhrA